ncbi:MAG: polysaccharide deacetylase family protein [Chloroflexi bacterium]|nr:polysaccharide deacetylase family protein [Chloroflexota bacterium]
MSPILMYHRIAQVPREHDPRGLAVPPRQFERQMAYLKQHGYQCILLDNAAHRLRTTRQMSRKSFVLTFDDGYHDFYSVAFPILQNLGFAATVFLVAGRVGGYSNWNGQPTTSSAPLLSWEEIRELACSGFTIGSHTLTHPRLTLLDDDRAVHEIRDSKTIIEDSVGAAVDVFAYPYTDLDLRIRRIVVQSGYAAACGRDRGRWGLDNLWRAQVGRNDTLGSFVLKLCGYPERLAWLREESRLGQALWRTARVLKPMPAMMLSRVRR